MKFVGMTSRNAATAVVGVIAFFVGRALCSQHHDGPDPGHIGTGFQYFSQPSAETPTVEACGAKGRDGNPEKELKLNATAGTPLHFRCGTDEVLSPAKEEGRFPNVYAVSPEGVCVTTTNTTLETQVPGATLVEVPRKQLHDQVPDEGQSTPVYKFQYSSGPSEDKHLCYTCNSTAASEASLPSAYRLRAASAESRATCTVFIRVPRAASGVTTPTVPSTPAPSSAFSTGAMTIPIAIAAGGVLAVVLRP